MTIFCLYGPKSSTALSHITFFTSEKTWQVCVYLSDVTIANVTSSFTGTEQSQNPRAKTWVFIVYWNMCWHFTIIRTTKLAVLHCSKLSVAITQV